MTAEQSSRLRVPPSIDAPTTRLENARVVTPTGVIADGAVVIESDRIRRVGGTGSASDVENRIDVGGRTVMPGLVDIHGDDIERHLFPRSEARVDTETALVAADRANLAAGVTTKYHAIAYEDAPEKRRSVDLGDELVERITTAEGLLGDHRVHARCEVSDPACTDAVVRAIDRESLDLVSLMHHAPGSGQFEDFEQFARRYGGETLAQQLGERRCSALGDDAVDRIERVIDHAGDVGVTVASHDDDRPSTVEWMHERGVDICEYPVSAQAAGRARDLGMVTAMGAPNLVRGGSLWGNLNVREAIEAGLVDVLCSDYHPRSMLAAPFVETSASLADRVARVTSAPAAAMGLEDRGRIETGARADLIVVEPEPVPVVTNVFVAGSEVYRAG